MLYYANRISENIARSDEGYLICRGVPVARSGTQRYLASELGLPPPERTIHVMRPESEVFSPACMASFEGKPVTDGHPSDPDGVTAANIRYLQKGHAQNIRRGKGKEKQLLLADLVITDPDTVDSVLRGKREISCGYTYTLDTENGRMKQREIRGNHIAIVDKGRAGPRVAIRDSEPEHYQRSVKPMQTRTRTAIRKLISAALRGTDLEPADLTELTRLMSEVPDAPEETDEPDANASAARLAGEQAGAGKNRAEASDTEDMPEASEISEARKTPETQAAHETRKVPEALRAPEAKVTHETRKVLEAPEISEARKTPGHTESADCGSVPREDRSIAETDCRARDNDIPALLDRIAALLERLTDKITVRASGAADAESPDDNAEPGSVPGTPDGTAEEPAETEDDCPGFLDPDTADGTADNTPDTLSDIIGPEDDPGSMPETGAAEGLIAEARTSPDDEAAAAEEARTALARDALVRAAIRAVKPVIAKLPAASRAAAADAAMHALRETRVAAAEPAPARNTYAALAAGARRLEDDREIGRRIMEKRNINCRKEV